MPVVAAFMVPHPPMIIPAVGKGTEKQIEKTREAYLSVARDIARLAPETLVVFSPHATMYADYFHVSPGRSAAGSMARFGAGQVRFRETYDTELVACVEDLAFRRGIPAGTRGEREKALDHGTMVPLWFIRQVLPSSMLVRVGLSGLPLSEHYRLGQVIRDAAEKTGRRVVCVASGDLSHKLQSYGPYGFAPEGPQYDERLMDVCRRAAFGELLDFDEGFLEKAAECGHRSFVIMAGALDGCRVRAEVLSHEDVTGVGYGICAFLPGSADADRQFLRLREEAQARRLASVREKEDAWVRLAREALAHWVLRREPLPVPEGLPAAMTGERAGVFVSLHRQGRLRGCIGTIAPTCPSVAEEIIRNARAAGTQDPRFEPVAPGELDELEIHVDVLGKPEPVASEAELDVKRYGVIVRRGSRQGLLLPDLEGVDSVREQVAIARRKAGIGAGEAVSLLRFEVIRHT